MSATSTSPITSAHLPSSERITELHTALGEIRTRVAAASNSPRHTPTLVAVSKYKPAADVRACYDAGQRDFGENYAHELAEKAALLPRDVRWHFIGTVQSNKAKALAGEHFPLLPLPLLPPLPSPFPTFSFISTMLGGKPGIENLYAVQTLASTKVADALNRHRAASHAPLRVLIQLNTSGEETKGGIVAAADEGTTTSADGDDAEEVARLATHVVRACPRLRLVGLMTIGAAGGGEGDFAVLRGARERLLRVLPDDGVWGEDEDGDGNEVTGPSPGREDADAKEGGGGPGRRLLLSMGMSHDFELALRAGADIVRVGTGIFGARPPKKGGPHAEQS